MIRKFISIGIFFISVMGLYASEDWTDHVYSHPLPDPKDPTHLEQISCPQESCIRLSVDENDPEKTNESVRDQVYDLMGEMAGKIVVAIEENQTTISSDENEGWRTYLREIAKREGSVVFEPYHIKTRGMLVEDLPLFGDVLQAGYSLFSRGYSFFVYPRMKHYNAKVLYHPVSKKVLLYYFVHRDYGSLCETVFSKCNVIEYLDDEIFDMQLQEALKKYPAENIIIRFDETEATLPSSEISIDNLMSMNRSGRLYKWMIAAKEVETKPLKKERFLTTQAIVSLINYSISAYDYVQAIRMYSNASEWKAIATYRESGDKKVLHSMEFKRIENP